MVGKRNVHSYKITDKLYKKAMKRAKKEKTTLSERIEEFVTKYSEGMKISYSGLHLFNYGGVPLQTIMYTDIEPPQPKNKK